MGLRHRECDRGVQFHPSSIATRTHEVLDNS
jgi:anthranilate/para-aminobenzoate synthase component II